MRYSVFEGMDQPGKACVIVNFGNEEETAEVTWPGGEGTQVEILVPFQPDRIATLPVVSPPGAVHLRGGGENWTVINPALDFAPVG